LEFFVYDEVAEYGYLLQVMILNTAFRRRTFTSFKYFSAAFFQEWLFRIRFCYVWDCNKE